MVPVVDGPGGFLPEMPVDMRKSGSVMNGPIISGINEEDGSLGAAFCESDTKPNEMVYWVYVKTCF